MSGCRRRDNRHYSVFFCEADKTATGLQQAIFPGVGAGVLRTQPIQVISITKGGERHGFRFD